MGGGGDLGVNTGDIFYFLQANLIDSSSLQLVPTPQQVNEWQNRTKTPFDPLVSLREATGRPVKDPFSTSGKNIFVRAYLFSPALGL